MISSQPKVLQGQIVVLEPMVLDHVPELEDAARDGELWRLWFTSVPSPGKETQSYVEEALEAHVQGSAMPFVVRDLATETIVGSTRYCNIDTTNVRLEIGYTWYSKRTQRTGVNTDCKMLLLTLAFEHFEVIAVELRTHRLNRASRRAIERLGAVQDGILRSHQRLADGSLRDTVVYSILSTEWPTVKRNLSHLLDRQGGGD